MQSVKLTRNMIDQMTDLETVEHERVGNQTAMTPPPQRLGAHERQAPPRRGFGLEHRQRGPEVGAFHVGRIRPKRAVGPGCLAIAETQSAPASKLVPTPFVVDPGSRKLHGKPLARELRVTVRSREAADVD